MGSEDTHSSANDQVRRVSCFLIHRIKEHPIVNSLDIIPKEDKFIVAGKRMQIYNNDLMRRNLRAFNEELRPLACEFNLYYKTFVVMTK